jgi:DNA primase
VKNISQGNFIIEYLCFNDMISYTTIEKILDAIKIEDVIGEFVTLHRSGRFYKGLCPFHEEHTPSFTVTPHRNMFYCFGCKKRGDAITFLMEHENMTYPEASQMAWS